MVYYDTLPVKIQLRIYLNISYYLNNCDYVYLTVSFIKEIMRKLKGAVKETARQKRERKQEFAKCRQQIHTVVLPTCAVIFLLICIYVYFKTRPPTMQYA
ncbi:hypothetical protein NE865_05720 [Phthorimaea operculella]|nr:hypothetical protein NE865_05720 [Phthorimaea operculella]